MIHGMPCSTTASCSMCSKCSATTIERHFPIGLRSTVNAFAATDPGEIEMWFTVRDFDDAVERVRIAGGTVLTITGYDSGREARCEDDQGALFRLSQPAPGYDAD